MTYYLLQFENGENHLIGTDTATTYIQINEIRNKLGLLPPLEFVHILCAEHDFKIIPKIETGLIIHAINFKPQRIKCKTHKCVNHTDEGSFVGDFCVPCYLFIIGESSQINNQIVRNALEMCQQKLFPCG